MAAEPAQGRHGERGMALLFVLLVVALLSALVLEFSYDALVDLRVAETFRDRTRAGYIARGGVVAGQMFLREDRNGYDAQTELWAQGVADYPIDEGSVSIRMTDLGGRLDVNRLVTSQGNPDPFFWDRFERLLGHLEILESDRLGAALIDWLDPDDEAEPLGAEDNYYQSLAQPYACKNGPLDALEELYLVRGFSRDIVERLRPHVTLHGGEKINVNTATPEVLASLAEDLALTTTREIVEELRTQPVTAIEQLQEYAGSEVWYAELRPYLQVSSANFEVRSRGAINDAVRVAVAEINRDTNRVYSLRLE